jgi:hypothetical protein
MYPEQPLEQSPKGGCFFIARRALEVPKKNENGLNLQQEEFCQLYTTDAEFFGNGVQAYIEAYKPDQSKPNWYKTSLAAASRLLANVKICERINQLLEEGGLNDQFVDKQLTFLVTQHADFKSKLGAIKEYNKLKKRVSDRLEHTGKDGGAIEQQMAITYMPEPLDADYFRRPANNDGQ